MELGTLLVGLALLVVVAFIIAQPFLEKGRVPREPVTEVEALLAERENILSALRDLDFDHATGKITTDDYTPQRAKLVAEGAEVLRQLDRLSVGTAPTAVVSVEDEIERAVAARRRAAAPTSAKARGARQTADPDAEIEAEVAARRAKAPSAAKRRDHSQTDAKPLNHFCPQCGTPVQPDDRFCARCGSRLVPAGSPTETA
jgi:hypothetical protein